MPRVVSDRSITRSDTQRSESYPEMGGGPGPSTSSGAQRTREMLGRMRKLVFLVLAVFALLALEAAGA